MINKLIISSYILIESNIRNYILQTESKFINWFNERANEVNTKKLLIQSKALSLIKDKEKDIAGYLSSLKVITESAAGFKLKYIQEKTGSLRHLADKFINSKENSLSGYENRF